MDPLRFAIAMGPLALYLLLLGMINASRHPLVVRGIRDTLALGVAVAGLVMIGPMELLMPVQAALVYQGYIWVMLGLLYLLILLLIALTQRHRIVVYNVDSASLRSRLAEIAARIDPQSVWAGDSLDLPAWNIHLYLDISRLNRNITLTATSRRQPILEWLKLEHLLEETLASTVAPRSKQLWLTQTTAALLIIASIVILFALNPESLDQTVIQLFYP